MGLMGVGWRDESEPRVPRHLTVLTKVNKAASFVETGKLGVV